MLTQVKLKADLRYDKITGIFYRNRSHNRWIIGSIAGTIKKGGYVGIHLNGIHYLAHRLAWFYEYGVWPDIIDHIDGITFNNEIANLRNTNFSGNTQNKKVYQSNNITKLLGVGKSRSKFRARITVLGKKVHLGTFPTPEEAHQAYLIAKRRLHETCTI